MTQQVMEPPDSEVRGREIHEDRTGSDYDRGSEQNGRRSRAALIVVALFLLLLIVGAIIGFVVRRGEHRALVKETNTLAVPSVAVIHPKPEPPKQDIELPSTLQAFTESPIYARTNGYLKKWYKDIGSKVAKGELLADIETPEVDQELMQSRAARDQSAAQLEIAKTSAKRWEDLRKQDAVAQQETDERSNVYLQSQANLAAADANVKRLQQLESFKHVYAPFSGVVTKRLIDVGALINAGNTGMNQELFDLAKIDPIRVYIDVPEIYSPYVHRGVKGTLVVTAMPDKKFGGEVVRTADAIDPTTRTLRTEIDVPNPEGLLLPGAFAKVTFAVNVNIPRLSVPVNALLFREQGMQAAVVDQQGIVHLKKVVIGRDYGTDVEIMDGVQPNDSLILNPGDSLSDGQQVHVASDQGQVQGKGNGAEGGNPGGAAPAGQSQNNSKKQDGSK